MKSNRTKRKPDNYKSMGACAHKAAKTLETRGKSWLHGMAWELLPGSELAGGRSADYIIGEKRVCCINMSLDCILFFEFIFRPIVHLV